MADFLKLGDNFHVNGDSTKSDSYDKVMNGEKAKFLFADPPYCLLTRRRKDGRLRDPKKAKINHESVKKYESVKEYRAFTKAWMSEAVKHISEDGLLFIWTNFLGKAPIKQVAKDLGYTYFRGEFKWAKLTKEGSGNELLARLYEVGLVFSKLPISSLKDDEMEVPWSHVSGYDEDKSYNDWGAHPNHKAFSLLSPIIRAYTKPGDRILDTFSGSGSTPEAAIRLGRKVSAIELRSHWADLCQDRMKIMFNKNN